MRFLATNPDAVSSIEAVQDYRLPAFLGRIRLMVNDWLVKRAVLAELHGLDERTRADLRIYPGDFHAIANGTYVRGPALDADRVSEAATTEKQRQNVFPYY